MTEQVAMNEMMKNHLGTVIHGVGSIVVYALYLNKLLVTALLVLAVGIGVILDTFQIDKSTLLRRRVGSIESSMPPKKKTKPNEKCPCGSGKKHKKCCMVAGKRASSVVATASSGSPPSAAITNPVLEEVMAALSLSTTTTTSAAVSDSIDPCCHGSTSAHFPDGRAYSDVIEEFLAVSDHEEYFGDLNFFLYILLNRTMVDFIQEFSAVRSVGKKGWRAKFEQDHKKYCTDLKFAQYIFSVCTSWYLKTNHASNDMKELLVLAVVIKYLCHPRFAQRSGGPAPDHDKLNRYYRAIYNNDDRGVIHCLSRETNSFCDCMQAKNTEAKGMEKTNKCYGCKHSFPRKGMLKCRGCKIAIFCNEDCYKKNWPSHKEGCKKASSSTTTTTTTTVLDEGMEALSLASDIAINTATATRTIRASAKLKLLFGCILLGLLSEIGAFYRYLNPLQPQ